MSEKETPEFIPSQLWPSNPPDLKTADYSVLGILQEKVYKICIADLDELKQRLRMEWAKLDHVVIAAAIHQWRRRAADQCCVLCAPPLQYFPQMLSTGFKSGKCGGHS